MISENQENQDTHDFCAWNGIAASHAAARSSEMVFRKGAIWRSGQQKALRRED